jgi:hypothetical protein
MATTILGLEKGFEYGPEIVSVTGNDGITAFSFNIIGKFTEIRDLFVIGQVVSGVPNQPLGSYKCVSRNLEHVAGGQSGIYKLSVSAQGGTDNPQQISESSYTYQTADEDGFIFALQLSVRYRLEWLYPSVTITTNSNSSNASKAEAAARALIGNMPVQIISDKPATFGGNSVTGKKIDQIKIILSGSSVEQAGGLYRIRATASKGASLTV